MARPRKIVDPAKVTQLAKIGCSVAEIASVLDCSERTLFRCFGSAIKKGHDHMRASLRRQQYKLAMDGNPTMAIWLGKQVLGQKDKPDGDDNGQDSLVALTKEMRAEHEKRKS